MYPGIGRGPVFWWCTIRIIYHLVHHLQTPLTELNIVYMWGFLITVEVMTPPEPDLVYTLTAGSRPPVWFYGYCPSSPAHHHQTELPSLTTTLPAAPAKTLSTCPPAENIYISKNLHVYTRCGYKEGLWNTVPRPGLFLWLVKVTLIYMRERLTLGNIIRRSVIIRDTCIMEMIGKGDFTYYTEII